MAPGYLRRLEELASELFDTLYNLKIPGANLASARTASIICELLGDLNQALQATRPPLPERTAALVRRNRPALHECTVEALFNNEAELRAEFESQRAEFERLEDGLVGAAPREVDQRLSAHTDSLGHALSRLEAAADRATDARAIQVALAEVVIILRTILPGLRAD